jgi:hypothetical protein
MYMVSHIVYNFSSRLICECLRALVDHTDEENALKYIAGGYFSIVAVKRYLPYAFYHKGQRIKSENNP